MERRFVVSHEKIIQHSNEILGGTPVFLGTRVPVQILLDYLEEGNSLEDFLEDFPSVKKDHAIAVLEAAKKELLRSTYESAA